MSESSLLDVANEPRRMFTVLVIDDDDVDRERLIRLMRRYPANIRITETNSKLASLELLRVQQFDFIFLDFKLQDGDGRDLVPQIQSLSKRLSLIVAVTGNGSEQQAAAAIKAGIHEYLPKATLTEARLFQALEDGWRYLGIQAKLREAEMQLHRRSLYDTLTDLPNRNLFFDRLEQACANFNRNRKAFTVLMIDLDRFKEVNDSFGHHAGDQVLREVGGRFAAVLRATDTIARLGGDEFAVILPEVDSPVGAESVCNKLLQSLNLPVMAEGQALSVGASIGIAICPLHAEDTAALMRMADKAMYSAKRGLNKIVVHGDGEGSGARTQSVHALIVELEKAIRENELVMYYQPQIRLDTRAVVGFEALVRWQHQERGLLGPEVFIPTMESSNLLQPFTDKTVDLALAQYARWQEQKFAYKLSINISPRMLDDKSFVQRILSRLAHYRIPNGVLSLELTETSLLVNLGRARAIVEQLREHGITLSIDDFGAGFTSFTYLKDFAAPEIKLDCSFVTELEENSFNASLVRSMSVLCDALGADFIAEGVERHESWPMLLELGCRLGQGFSIARPMPATAVVPWLAQWARQRANFAVH